MSKAQFWARETILTIEFRRPRIILRFGYMAGNRSRFSKHQMTGSPIFSVNLYKIEKFSDPEMLYRSQVYML